MSEKAQTFHTTKNSLYVKMKLSKQQLAVCPITGILITLDIPFLPNKILSYENPLARIDNAKEIASLEYKEQAKISPHVLAGILLTLLNHYELIEDHLSSTERNQLLSTIPVYYLCDALHFLASNTARRIAMFPKLSLASISTEYSQPHHLLKNYIEVCRATLVATFSPSLNKDIMRTERKTRKEDKQESLSVETRKRAKNLVNTLISSEILNPKAITLFKLICQGNNLITLHSELREKLVSKLRTFTSPCALELASLIEDVESNISSNERIFKQQDDTVLDTLTSSLPSYGTRKSLKDILEEKLSQRKDNNFAEQQPSSPETHNNIPPSNEKPSILNLMEEIRQEILLEEELDLPLSTEDNEEDITEDEMLDSELYDLQDPSLRDNETFNPDEF